MRRFQERRALQVELRRGDSRSAPSTFYIRSPIHRLRNLRQRRIMQLWTESVELLETHDERPPLVRVDPVVLPGHQNRLFQMHALNAHLDDENSPALCRIMLRQVVETLDLRFELDRTFPNARRFERLELPHPVLIVLEVRLTDD